jgi:carboxymethylenebutenolidase
MSRADITIETTSGKIGGYLAKPASGRGPGIVVIQEIFGVNQVMRELADGFAARGYFAPAPDLFWRLEPGVQLTDKTDADWKRAFDLMNKFDPKTGVEDIQATINTLRHTEGCSGKVGAVGYCLGGMLAYLAATRTDADASVSYYGVNIQTLLGESRNIKQPLMLHIAGKDEFVKSEAQRQIVDGLKDNPLVTVHTYPEMDHAFARVGGAHYDHANAELANGRTATFFRQHLS